MTATFSSKEQLSDLLDSLGVNLKVYEGSDWDVTSPADGEVMASLRADTASQVDEKIQKAQQAFLEWRQVPAPQRGEFVRLLGLKLRERKDALGALVSLECGKIYEEGKGEVQEMIDICDFALGLSRKLYGLTIASERVEHCMSESWHPLGPVAVITAFNFPVAVWSWNAAIAFVCGDSVLWKPSEKTPLTALACQSLLQQTAKDFEKMTGQAIPEYLSQVIIGGREQGDLLVQDPRLPLISATGSCRMGKDVAEKVARRLGRSILELGGNNAIIVTASADLQVALPSIIFGAVGTAGQRCTTTRRLFVEKSKFDAVFQTLQSAYDKIAKEKVGNPLESQTLVGPLIDEASFQAMQEALSQAKREGGEVFNGGRVLESSYPNAFYAEPALVKMPQQTEVVMQETFAPILYVMPYEEFSQVMQEHNAVPQGLSSAIFTTDLREAESFRQLSDTGITNVNIGTSGAEIGGAFGGEKETGGGRESGSDAWKAYMRRQTSTVYYGLQAPQLAQGLQFDM